MVEERITTVDPRESGATHTTIITDGGNRRGGGAGWLIAIVLIVALIIGFMMFSRVSESDAAKDNAIANAAGDIGDAAQKVGNAADSAADKLKQ